MKRILCVLTLLIMSISVPCQIAAASNNPFVISETKEYLADGGYLLITVSEDTAITPCATIYTKSGTKTTTYVSSDGIVQWSFTVHGTFQINSGVSASCTSSSYSSDIAVSSWHLGSAASNYSGNHANGSATFNKKVLFITTDTVNVNVILTCDSNGNLS